MNIIIFGTGSCCEKILQKLDYEKVNIVGFCDNDENKQNKIFCDIPIHNPENILNLQYDLILIASEFSVPIFQQLVDMGISVDKIIPVLHTRFIRELDNIYYSRISEIKVENRFRKKRRFKKRIALLRVNNSGSNTLALSKNMPKYIRNKYEVRVIDRNYLDKDSAFDLICSTSLSSIYHPSIINVQLWHGFPLKKIGTRTELFLKGYNDTIKNNIKKIISYSELYSSLFNASFPNTPEKYEITGMPRNDLLFHKNFNLMKDLWGNNITDKKIIVYMPTYRVWKHDLKANGDRSWDNIFGFKEFDLIRFAEFLRENKLFFIFKLHHMEYNEVNEKDFEKYKDVISFIEEDELIEKEIDLYEILANVDLLITDYSSVYFDLLIINTPIIFVPIDIDSYEKNRGFNLEPYEFWAPGPKVFNQDELIINILNILNDDKYYSRRKELCNIVHKHKDNKASERVWEMVDKLLEEHS